MSLVVAVLTAITMAGTILATHLARVWGLPPPGTIVIAAVLVLPFALWAIHVIVSRISELSAVLGNALGAFKDGDFSLRLTVRGDSELAELKQLYNELADRVRDDRQELREKEILLDTVLQRTPVAVVLLDGAERVIYSNVAARELLAGGARLNGRLIAEIGIAQSLRDALASPADTLFAHEDETFHLSQRIFHLNTQSHRLLLIERLTPELRRQEVSVWKKAIRVINHEINNTVAPISSLFHSARVAQAKPELHHRLDEIYGHIEERLTFLRNFLESYAGFARLPAPHKEPTAFTDVLETVRVLYPFRVEGHPETVCSIDRVQMQQVMINLVKNAHESGSAPEEVVVSVQRAGDDCVVRVMDRGRGMSEEVMRQALVPFYTTKPDGSGVGLALANEIVESHGGRLRLAAREGGGTVVTCWLGL